MICSAKSRPDANTGSEAPRVFVVDDERLVAEIVDAILRLEGYSVRFFTNPDEALRAFEAAAEKPHVLVTDYVMRPLNGMELIQKCRALDPRLLTLLYTGNTTSQITDLYATKPHAFLEKPFHPKKLVRIVSALLENRRSTAMQASPGEPR